MYVATKVGLTLFYYCRYWFLQRVRIACYAERCISYDRFRPSDRLTVTLRYHVRTTSAIRSCGLHWRIAP